MAYAAEEMVGDAAEADDGVADAARFGGLGEGAREVVGGEAQGG